MAHPVAQAMPLPAAELRADRVRELRALAAFEVDQASPVDWVHLAHMTRVAHALAGAGVGPECLPITAAVWTALQAAWRDPGPMGLGSDGLDLVRELLALHDDQRRMASRAEYGRAVREAMPEGADHAPR